MPQRSASPIFARPVLAVLALAAVLLVAPALAHARTSYCSPKRSYCTAVKKRHGAVLLRLRTARIHGRYTLCVTQPAPASDTYVDPFASRKTCRRFRLRKRRHGGYASTVSWRRHFPHSRAGVYRVRWRRAGHNLGPRLSFRH